MLWINYYIYSSFSPSPSHLFFFSELCCEKSRPNQLKFSSSANHQQFSMYNSDYGELVWENGQVVIKGGQFSKDSVINSKTGKYGTGLGFDEAVSGDADLVPWLYNFDDTLHHESASGLLAETSGVTGNDLQSYSNFSTTHKLSNPVKDSALVALDNNNGLSPPYFNSKLSSVAGNSSCKYAQASESLGDQSSKMELQKHQDKKVRNEANFSFFSRCVGTAKYNTDTVGASASSLLTRKTEAGKYDNLGEARGQTIFATGKDLLGEPIEKQVIGGNVQEEGLDVEKIREWEPVAAAPSVCSENSGLRASNNPTNHLKRKYNEEEDFESSSDDSEGDSGSANKAGSKRNQAAEVHNLTERKRREKINDKIRALQELVPNCNKADKATMLDEAIDYLRVLQFQVQMMSMGGKIFSPSMMPQPGLQHFHALSHFPQFVPMGMGYQANTLNTTPGFPTYFPAHSNPPAPLWNAAHPLPMSMPVLPEILTPKSAVTPIAVETPNSKFPHLA